VRRARGVPDAAARARARACATARDVSGGGARPALRGAPGEGAGAAGRAGGALGAGAHHAAPPVANMVAAPPQARRGSAACSPARANASPIARLRSVWPAAAY
jgi:hypothetical protein